MQQHLRMFPLLRAVPLLLYPMIFPRVHDLFLITLFKLCKALMLLLLAYGFLSLPGRHRVEVESWLEHVPLSPRNRLTRSLLENIAVVSPRELKKLVEGVGLLTRQRWAELLSRSFLAVWYPIVRQRHHASGENQLRAIL